MISNPEDAALLLNKWIASEARVVAFIRSAERGFLARLDGVMLSVDEQGNCLFASGEDFIVFTLNCVIGYGEQIEMPNTYEQALANEAEQWTAILNLRYSTGEQLVLCTME